MGLVHMRSNRVQAMLPTDFQSYSFRQRVVGGQTRMSRLACSNLDSYQRLAWRMRQHLTRDTHCSQADPDMPRGSWLSIEFGSWWCWPGTRTACTRGRPTLACVLGASLWPWTRTACARGRPPSCLCHSCRAYFSGLHQRCRSLRGSLVPSWLPSDVAGMFGYLCYVPRLSKDGMFGRDAELVASTRRSIGWLLVSSILCVRVPVSFQPQVFQRVWTTLCGFLSLVPLAHIKCLNAYAGSLLSDFWRTAGAPRLFSAR